MGETRANETLELELVMRLEFCKFWNRSKYRAISLSFHLTILATRVCTKASHALIRGDQIFQGSSSLVGGATTALAGVFGGPTSFLGP